MAAEVLYHPTAALAKKMDDLVDPGTSDLVELMLAHLDAGVPRVPLARAVEAGRFNGRGHGQALLSLLEWAADKSFFLESEEENLDESSSAEAKERALIPEFPDGVDEKKAEAFLRIREAAFSEAAEDSRLEQLFRDTSRTERHPNFPPAWGLDTITWSQVFGAHDPVPTIDFYLARFFDDEIQVREFVELSMAEEDVVIWRTIVESFSLMPWQVRCYAAELDAGQKVRALNTALKLPDEVGPALSLADSDLSEIIATSPGWMASRIIDWWALADIEWHRRRNEEVKVEVPGQAEVVYRIMVRHLVDWQTMSDEDLEATYSVTCADLQGLPDYSPACARSYERIIEAFWDAFDEWDENFWYRESLTRALYHARSRVFGDCFPLPPDSILALATLNQEEGYWLAHFCNSQANPRQIFRYLSFHIEPIPDDVFGARQELLVRARRRLTDYRAALEQILDDGCVELARAWWSFFMASQSQMFSGFGLSASESRAIVEIAGHLLPDRGIEKAFEFVRRTAAEGDNPLMQRTALAMLPERTGGPQVSALGGQPVADFLSARIMFDVWQRLHPETRQDIMDAESLWDRAAREMGAGRTDWGGLGIVYARAVERELKAHVLPLLEQLRSDGMLGKGRRTETIGSIVSACGNAVETLQEQPGQETVDFRNALACIHEAFCDDLKVVTQIRNRAAHGDRSDPVVRMEFVELRSAIFERGAFRIILACSEALE